MYQCISREIGLHIWPRVWHVGEFCWVWIAGLAQEQPQHFAEFGELIDASTWLSLCQSFLPVEALIHGAQRALHPSVVALIAIIPLP
jgi:hypothetical protein